MNERAFVKHAASEPMTILRKRYNRGESLYKDVPESISRAAALEDVHALRYVMEQAYSGYGYHEKECFDDAFAGMETQLCDGPDRLTVNDLIDLMAARLSFICDGHLSLTTKDYGKGFYRQWHTYVADLRVLEENGGYVDAATGAEAILKGEARLFPTLPVGGRQAYLAGVRSRKAVEEIGLRIGAEERKCPVHRIRSARTEHEQLLLEDYSGDAAYIASSTFVGDDERDMERFYNAGLRCREYRHVVLDLSNNLGGNSEFAKRFLTGLNGVCSDTSRIFELHSTLVHAKESGVIEELPYHFEEISGAQAKDAGLFQGTLHVLINDHVASSAESAIIMAKSLKNTVFYGCNSMGIGRFGDLHIHYLPNSNITLWCPQKVFDSGIEETLGYAPDYWLDSCDPAAELMCYIRNLE